MAQLVNCQLDKDEGLSLVPKHLHERQEQQYLPGVVALGWRWVDPWGLFGQPAYLKWQAQV